MYVCMYVCISVTSASTWHVWHVWRQHVWPYPCMAWRNGVTMASYNGNACMQWRQHGRSMA
jgi:hypothetical protein